MMRTALALLLFFATACASTQPEAHAPWSSTVPAADVPAVYVTQWQKAANRDTCALIAPQSVGEAGAAATPRAANFSGGWAVSYDLPDLRSAFGVAGTGAKAADPSYNEWPYRQEWPEGKAEYGPEGGTGPNQLAYVRIQGQDCLYNVWSRLGREHLELLIRELRTVKE